MWLNLCCLFHCESLEIRGWAVGASFAGGQDYIADPPQANIQKKTGEVVLASRKM